MSGKKAGEVVIKNADGTSTLYLWGSGAITCTQAVHYRINNSKEWLSSYRWTGVEDAASVYFHIKTLSKMVAHGTITVITDGKAYVDIFEDPTLTDDGTALPEYCMNRKTILFSTTQTFRDPTVTNDGRIIEYGMIGIGGKFTASGGDTSGAYWYLDDCSSYIIKVTNQSGADIDVVITYQFHEHTCQ